MAVWRPTGSYEHKGQPYLISSMDLCALSPLKYRQADFVFEFLLGAQIVERKRSMGGRHLISPPRVRSDARCTCMWASSADQPSSAFHMQVCVRICIKCHADYLGLAAKGRYSNGPGYSVRGSRSKRSKPLFQPPHLLLSDCIP